MNDPFLGRIASAIVQSQQNSNQQVTPEYFLENYINNTGYNGFGDGELNPAVAIAGPPIKTKPKTPTTTGLSNPILNPVVMKQFQDRKTNMQAQLDDQNSQYYKDKREREDYYNPKIREGYTSGSQAMDFVYNHPWLIKTPIIGDYIKDKAYQMAIASKGYETVSPKQIDDVNSGKLKGSYSGQNLLDPDNKDKTSVNLLDQYFGKISLPASKFTPTSDYLNFLPSVSIKGNWEKNAKDHNLKNWVNQIQGMAGETLPSTDKIATMKPIYAPQGSDNEITVGLGVNLNGHKLGIAYDADRKLPYMSVSDAWDFEPKSYRLRNALLEGADKATAERAYIESSLMQQAGKPFKIYDRLYFDPKTYQYIPDDKLPSIKK